MNARGLLLVMVAFVSMFSPSLAHDEWSLFGLSVLAFGILLMR